MEHQVFKIEEWEGGFAKAIEFYIEKERFKKLIIKLEK